MTCHQYPSVRLCSERLGNPWGRTHIMPFAICTDLRMQFQEIARKYSPEPRFVYAFLTTAIVRPSHSLSIYVSECDGAILIVIVVWTGHRSYGRHAWDDPREDRQRQPPIRRAHTLTTLYLDPEVTNTRFSSLLFSPSYNSWFST